MLNTKHEKLEELTHIRSCSKCNIIYNIRNLNEDGLCKYCEQKEPEQKYAHTSHFFIVSALNQINKDKQKAKGE